MEALNQQLEQLKLAINSDPARAHRQLTQLKLEMTKHGFLLPSDTTDARQFVLARELLELAVLLSVKEKDIAAFERSFAQLKTYYTDVPNALAKSVPQSERRWLLVGVNLMRLLALTHIDKFHTELETIPYKEQQENLFVRHSIALEQYLMEGRYNKIYEAHVKAPHELFQLFSDMLVETIRVEVAASIEKAYAYLKVPDAQKLLRLNSTNEVLSFAKQRNWTVNGDVLRFPAEEQPMEEKGEKLPGIPSRQIIHEGLLYAKELERIV